MDGNVAGLNVGTFAGCGMVARASHSAERHHRPHASVPGTSTAHAAEFDGEIPVGAFALIDGDDSGQRVVATLAQHRVQLCC